MRKGFLCTVVVSVASVSLALAQAPIASPYGTKTAPIAGAIVVPDDGPAKPMETLPIPSPSSGGNGNATACIDDCCWASGNFCGPPGRFWASAEYLLWWVKGSSLPPLVTTGPANATQVPPPGALGGNGTTVLFGGDPNNNGPVSGGRFTVGGWLNQGQTFGMEGSYFFLGSRSNNFTASSSGAPGSAVLARPFFDVSTGLPNSELISFPGVAAGTVNVQSTSQLQGAGANMLCNLCCSCNDVCNPCQPGYRVDFIGGFRYLDLSESLLIVETTQILPASPVFPGETIRAFDQINTRNQFYGGQIGIRAEAWRQRCFANITGMVALGDTHQTVDINGFTTFTPPLAGFGGRGDVLAQPSNIGHYTRDVFSVVSEVNFNLGYQVTDHVRVFAGYSFLYWSNVVRPGDVIDSRVNSTRTPGSLLPPSGPAAPSFAFRNSDFWAQGINVGVQARW